MGRLIAVVDATGQAAVYTYDASGNVLAITRTSTASVRVVAISPTSGPPGTEITIQGLGFSATPGLNTVTVNGATATVVTASSTKLVAVVPAAATTGPVAVTAPAGSAVGSTPFVVAASLAPQISSFSPTVVGPGGSVSITGTNFSAEASSNVVAFNYPHARALVQAATSSSLSVVVPPAATSGQLRVSTSYVPRSARLMPSSRRAGTRQPMLASPAA